MKARTRLMAKMSTGLFSVALGLAGYSEAIRNGGVIFDQPLMIRAATIVLVLAAIVLVIDIVLYIFKLVFARSKVIEDFSMATSANLLAPGFVAAMIISGSDLLNPDFAYGLWVGATLGHLLLITAFVGVWFRRDYRPDDLNPTWFLPSAGIMASAMMWPGIGPIEIPLFTLAVGAMLWVTLLPPIFRRMIVDAPVEPTLRPTLFILVAPFGLMAGAQLTLFQDLPIVLPTLFLLAGVFLILVLIGQARFLHRAGVSLTWWSATFPIAVTATGFFRLATGPEAVAAIMGVVLLSLVSLTTTLAILATILAGWNTFHPDNVRKDM